VVVETWAALPSAALLSAVPSWAALPSVVLDPSWAEQALEWAVVDSSCHIEDRAFAGHVLGGTGTARASHCETDRDRSIVVEPASC